MIVIPRARSTDPQRRGAWRSLVCATVLLACLIPAGAQDIVQQITSLVPDQPHTYEQMVASLQALRSTGRVSLMSLGKTSGGRDIVCAAVHHPQVRFGQGKRLFIIARQHGNEVSGTEAALALLQHFATSQGALECDILRYLTIIAVPMANPDGAATGRRRNGNGMDLNRDWAARTQAETQAIERGVRAWRPDAVLDLHELPASSGKPEYAESFVETIGSGSGISAGVSGHTLPAAADLSAWMGRYHQRGQGPPAVSPAFWAGAWHPELPD